MISKTPRLFLFCFLIGLIFRMSLVPFVMKMRPVSDSSGYLRLALSFKDGQGFSDPETGKPFLERYPGYPLFLVPVLLGIDSREYASRFREPTNRLAYGPRLVAIAVYQSSLQLGAFLLLISLLPPGKLRTFASILAALDPFSAMFAVNIFKETAAMIFLSLFLWLLVRGLEKMHILRLTGSMIFLGFSLITLPVLSLFPVLFSIVLILFFRNPKVFTLLFSMVFYFGYLYTITQVTGSFSIRKKTTTKIILHSVLWEGDGRFSEYDPYYKKVILPIVVKIEKEHPDFDSREKAYLNEALKVVRREPFRVAKRLVVLNYWFWMDYPGSAYYIRYLPHGRSIDLVLKTYQFLIMVGFLAGLTSFFRTGGARKSIAIAAGALFLYFVIFHIPFNPVPRYYMPIRPMLLSGAAGFFAWIYRKTNFRGRLQSGS